MSAGRSLALGVSLGLTFAAGLWLGGHPADLPPPLRDAFVDDAGGLTAEAGELIESNYYRSVSADELTDASLQGMVRGLRRSYRDRFSEYFSSETLKQFNEEIEGRFSGIGLSVTPVKRGLRAVQVFKGSPAERAGIEPGDVIVEVRGRSIAGVSSEAATRRIKGPEGTRVTIGVVRPPGSTVRKVRLTRAKIRVPVVSSELRTVGGKRLGYVRLAAFSQGAHGAMRNTVRRLERRGAEGLMIDLRGNGGGLLDEAVLVAGVFLPKDELVATTESRTQGDAVYRTKGGNLPALPMVVLIDGGTASAAEIFAAAVADNAAASIVGAKSFGKGVFQQEIGLSNGGALKLTIGEYFTPDGTNLAGEGIQPDVTVRDRPGTGRDEAVERALKVLARRRVEGEQASGS